MTHRLVLVVAVLVTTIALDATPASAHTVTGVSPTNYRSEILNVSPARPGVRFELLDLGRRVRLTNSGPKDLTILGYSGEPYLRVGPRGVFENTHAPTLYLNKASKTRASTSTTLPPAANAGAAPRWRKRSSADHVTWRDRRTRWEGPTPATVQNDRGSSHVVETWVLPATYGHGATALAVTGRITWFPPPVLRWWLVSIIVGVAATAAIGLAARWGLLMHVALALLIAVNAVHSFVAAIPVHDQVAVMILKVLGGGLIGTAGWVVGVVSFRSLDRNGEGGLLGAVIASLLIVIYGGATDVPMLTHSQVLYAAPLVVARVAVSLTIAVGTGILAAAGIVYARHAELRPAVAAALERDRQLSRANEPGHRR